MPIDRKTENALLRAMCSLIDYGVYALPDEDLDTEAGRAVVRFMIGLRQGSRVGLESPNVWCLDCARAHGPLVEALDGMLRVFSGRAPRGMAGEEFPSTCQSARDAYQLATGEEFQLRDNSERVKARESLIDYAWADARLFREEDGDRARLSQWEAAAWRGRGDPARAAEYELGYDLAWAIYRRELRRALEQV